MMVDTKTGAPAGASVLHLAVARFDHIFASYAKLHDEMIALSSAPDLAEREKELDGVVSRHADALDELLLTPAPDALGLLRKMEAFSDNKCWEGWHTATEAYALMVQDVARLHQAAKVDADHARGVMNMVPIEVANGIASQN